MIHQVIKGGTMTTKPLKEYDTTLDSKHRITVRAGSSQYKNYHVRVYRDGRILMEPRILIHPKYISEKTLKMMDRAMNNFAEGIVSEPIDFKHAEEIANGLPD